MKYLFSVEQMAHMRAMRQRGEKLRTIALKYDCSITFVHRLISGKCKRLQPKEPEPKKVARIRYRTAGRRERKDDLYWSEINTAATKWLIKKGLWTPGDEYHRL